jgi:hypothetical protein
MRAVITQWGADPLYQTAAVPPANPSTGAFPLAVRAGSNLSLPGAPETVDVAGHAVAFDAERKLWYCDVDVNLGPTYFPMVRLALARYQPSSLPDTHLSRVVLVDFTQVAPDRTVTVVKDPATPTRVTVSVSGPSYLATSAGASSAAIVTVRPEVRDFQIVDDLGWLPAPGVPTTVTLSLQSGGGGPLWRGTITLPSAPGPGTQRLVVEEYEVVGASANDETAAVATRIVFTDTIVL